MKEQGWNGRGGNPTGTPQSKEQLESNNRIRRIIISGGSGKLTAETPIVRIIEIKPPKPKDHDT